MNYDYEALKDFVFSYIEGKGNQLVILYTEREYSKEHGKEKEPNLVVPSLDIGILSDVPEIYGSDHFLLKTKNQEHYYKSFWEDDWQKLAFDIILPKDFEKLNNNFYSSEKAEIRTRKHIQDGSYHQYKKLVGGSFNVYVGKFVPSFFKTHDLSVDGLSVEIKNLLENNHF